MKIKQCIPIYDVCDSIAHCEDKTDELNCDSNKTSTIQAKSTTKSLVDLADYDEDYERDLLRQQNEILEHLRQLEEQNSNRFYHSKNFLENFMQEDETNRKKIRKTTTKFYSTREKILKPLFHGKKY